MNTYTQYTMLSIALLGSVAMIVTGCEPASTSGPVSSGENGSNATTFYVAEMSDRFKIL